MAREDTFRRGRESNSKSYSTEILNSDIKEDTLGSIQEPEEDAVLDFSALPKKEEVPAEPAPTKKETPPNLYKTVETKHRTVILNSDIDEALDSLVIDKKTKRRIKGSKGLIKKVVNNALIKELVYLHILDEDHLDNLEKY